MDGYNFSAAARRVISAAHLEAAARDHEYIGTEHLLLSAIRRPDEGAALLLGRLGVDIHALRIAIEELAPSGKKPLDPDRERPWTSGGQKVLEFAMMYAREEGRVEVDPGHLLVALLRVEKGIAAQVLRRAGVSAEHVVAARAQAAS
ncbi:MAG: Clp protease N-terminal domain-containing protein [Gemmatimonadota bacterium]